MPHTRVALVLLSCLLPLASTVAPAQAAPPRLARVSVASDGTQGNGGSTVRAVSGDGRFVVFASDASTLVPDDTNGLFDVFVRDRLTNMTIRVNVDSDGKQTTGASPETGGSFDASISADGAIVVFASNAANLVPGDTNGASDVFARDLRKGTTTLVSADAATAPGNGASDHPRISADGRVVSFASVASTLVPGDTNGRADMFVRELSGEAATATSRVSVDSAQTQTTGAEFQPAAISADGRYVAFSSQASSLVAGDTNGVGDVFLRDRLSRTTIRVSLDSAGGQASFSPSTDPAISADGRYVAFVSGASNVVTPDSLFKNDVFVRDTISQKTTRVSVDSAGVQANDHSGSPVISADGRFVAFTSSATNLAAFAGGGFIKVFLHDRKSGATQHASVTAIEQAAQAHSQGPVLSADGGVLAFSSSATFAADDTNGLSDVYVHDLLAPSPATVTHEAGRSLSLVDGPMAASSFAVGRSGASYVVTPLAPTAFPLPGAGCTASATVTCSGGLDSVFARLGDGDDRFNPGGCADMGQSALDGGDGNDVLIGGSGADTFTGGAGQDRFTGCGAADTFFGGPGIDRVDYPGSAAVTVAINNTASSGTVGEGDRLVGDIEQVTTGSGNDRVTGDQNPQTFNGAGGDDRLKGEGGADRLLGGTGSDTLEGVLGADVLDSRDGEVDALVDCGGDIDTANVDLLDKPVNCENVDQGAFGEGPHVVLGVKSALRLRSGRIAVAVGCPRRLRHACAGTLSAARTRSALARAPATRYRVRSGRRVKVRVRVARTVRRGARAYVQSVERGDVKGFKTTRRLVKIAR